MASVSFSKAASLLLTVFRVYKDTKTSYQILTNAALTGVLPTWKLSRAVASVSCTITKRLHHGHRPVSGCQSLGKWGFCTTTHVYTLRSRPNWRHFADVIFKSIFLKDNFEFWLKFCWNFFFIVQLNITTLVQIMAWHRPCDEPLYEPMMVS